jgi:metal iron transporter
MMVETELGVSSVTLEGGEGDVEREGGRSAIMIGLANNIPTLIGAWIVWLIITVMNIATLVFLGLGVSND